MTTPTAPETEFYFRTEDIPHDELIGLYVESKRDRDIIERLKGRSPVILVGSRGVGKSFLLRVAEHELSASFATDRILPVYASFNKSALLATSDPLQFQHYMLARICTRLLRSLVKHGVAPGAPATISILGGHRGTEREPWQRVEKISREYEGSYQRPGRDVDRTGLPSVEELRDAVEDLCSQLGVTRIVLLMDEAAHVFRPEQQRQFFTLFRDLRTSQLNCNAAVYPGVTAYGDSFQPAHDAAFVSLDRDVLEPSYVAQMREMVERQASSTLAAAIARSGQNFAVLAYAASGNPRLLFKTVAKAARLNAAQVNDTIKQFYRIDLWAEHSGLAEKYAGHVELIDWGRTFIEQSVLPELQQRNLQALKEQGETTCFFWIHRDAPAVVKEALRLLEYTGVVREHTRGIRATRSEIGTRYAVNLGCLFALEGAPRETGFKVAKSLGARRFVEYGANHKAYAELLTAVPTLVEADVVEVLGRQLQKSVNVLDLTDWQKRTLVDSGLSTLGDVLGVDEQGLKRIKYIGDKRARRMMNAVTTAVMEYMSG